MSIYSLGQVSINDSVDCEAANSASTSELSKLKFSYYPIECEYNKFTEQDVAVINGKFNSQCRDKAKCTFKFNALDLP